MDATSDTADATGTDGNADSGTSAPDQTFSQAEVDRHAGRARNEGRRTAERELAEQLGMTPAEAKRIIEAHNEAEDKNKSEAQRLRDEAEQARAEADRVKAEAAAERFSAKVERKLAAAGVGAGETDDAKVAAQMARAVRLVDLPADASDDDITAEIEALKADVPGLFGTAATAANGGKPTAPSGVTNGGKPPAGGQGAKSALERGADRWAAKNPPKSTSAA